MQYIENKGWNIDELINVIIEENPNISSEDAYKKAELIYKELNRLNNKMFNNDKKYYKHNIPLSLFKKDPRFF